jgi:hypothetical protein
LHKLAEHFLSIDVAVVNRQPRPFPSNCEALSPILERGLGAPERTNGGCEGPRLLVRRDRQQNRCPPSCFKAGDFIGKKAIADFSPVSQAYDRSD